jgi:Flp pilus assembly protein TadG
MRRVKSLASDEDGAELVEFALSATILFAMIFGIIQFSLLMFAGNFVAIAAQQGTRYAMVRGSDWTIPCAAVSSYDCEVNTPTMVQNYILSQPHPGLNLKASNITVTWPTTTASGATCVQYSQGCQVEVKVSYPFKLSIPLFSASFPLTSTSIETIQD